jgi:branched-chain amino acid transport system ATP-binding protein
MAAVSLLETRAADPALRRAEGRRRRRFRPARGEIHALIGPNGAGKTTFVGLICGRVPVQRARSRFDGRDITRLPAHARVRAGIAYTFQITSIYARLTVFDNVALAVQQRGAGIWRAETLAALWTARRPAGPGGAGGRHPSYGHQRLLEVAMGLALARAC